MLRWVGISRSKYYGWLDLLGQDRAERSKIPSSHWLLPEERTKMIAYAREHADEGYRRLTYMMLDDGVVSVSPSSTYRVLSEAGLLKRWNVIKTGKGKGFDQPRKAHEHWHTDIKYVNFHGAFLFLISVIDGFSRYIVHHELRVSMQEYDVQITIERALEKYPGVRPRLISDNGPQYVARDFTEYLRLKGLQHVRISVGYPQSNGKIERYHATITKECLRRRSFIDLDDARRQVASYIDFYNTERLHSAIYYLTPAEVLNGKMEERLREREEKLVAAAQYRRSVNRAA